MKKVKLNLDKKAIQDFFIHHVEKVLLVAVALCFLLFVYRAVGRETFTGTPQELKTDAGKAADRVAATKPVPPEDVVARNYLLEVKKSSEPIDVDPYQHRHLWHPLVVQPLPKRGEPILHAVRELRAAAGYGAIKVEPRRGHGISEAYGGGGPSMPGESLQGERWVVLTGLVPFEEQVEAYEAAFKNAADRQRGVRSGRRMNMGPEGSGVDRPFYVHYHVQRAEITGSTQGVDDLDWESIHVMNAKAQAARDWRARVGGTVRDASQVLVSPIYIIAALDFPLPPLVGHWTLGEEFAHAPEIPIVVQTKRTMFGPDGRPIGPDGRPLGPEDGTAADQPGTEKPPTEEPPTEEVADGPGADQPGDLSGQADMPSFSTKGRRFRPDMMNPQTPGMTEGPMMEPGLANPEMMPGQPGMRPGMRRGQWMDKEVPYRLFRFVDRTAEPGKEYRYRVSLVLWNPNYQKHPRFLERPELGKKEFIETEWSEPTAVVQVPRDDRLLVTSVRPSPRPTAEAEARVVVLKWLSDKGLEADKVFLTGQSEKALRGQVLNLPGVKWPEEAAKPRPKPEKKKRRKSGPGDMPGMEDYEMLMEGPQPESPRTGVRDMYGRGEQEPIDVDFLTESLILDMRGGQRIDLVGQGYPPRSRDPSVNAPGEVLVLDPQGKLVVRSELDDAAEYEALEQRKKEPTDGSMRPGMYPGMDGMMVPGMDGEGLLMEPAQPGRDAARKGKDRKKTGRERRPRDG